MDDFRDTNRSHQIDVNLNVHFVALEKLVAYLADSQQTKINALAATVSELNARLSTSSTDLKGTVDQQKET